MSLLLLLAAGDLIATVVRARREARAEAGQRVREAERYLTWAREHGTSAQLMDAEQLADLWHAYRDQL
ncbi:MAG: hypothetical protein ACRDYA_20835 [Egibacteraceae bacterium]